MITAKIAYRNVSRQKRRSNLLSAAIAFATMIIVLVNSLTAGLVRNTEENISSALGGHIYISGQVLLESGRTANRIDDTEVLRDILPRFDADIAASGIRSSASGSFIFGSRTARGTLYGVRWEEERELADSLDIVSGSLEGIGVPGSIVIPESIAEDIGAIAGERVIMDFQTVTGQANVGEFTIAAVFRETAELGLSAAYCDISFLNPLLGLGEGEYQTCTITLHDMKRIDRVSEALREAIGERAPVREKDESAGAGMSGSGGGAGRNRGSSGGPGPGFMGSLFGGAAEEETWSGTRFSVTTLNDFMDIITQVVDVLNAVAAGLFSVLLLIAMVGLVNTFRMIMIERTREIGTMRAMGVKKRKVQSLFLLEALFLALRGAAAGIAAAALLCLAIGAIPFHDSRVLSLILHNGHISTPLVPGNIILVTMALTATTLFSAWFPSRRAARLRPADALRSME